MPNTRMLLWVALAFILYLNYEAWTHDYETPAAGSSAGQSGAAAPSGRAGTLGDSVPQPSSAAPLPAARVPTSTPATPAPATAAPAATASLPASPPGAPT